MLKPKRKTTKEEIKKDSFVETVFNFRVLLKENSQILIRSVSVVGALIVIIILFSRINENNKNEAELLLTKSSLYRDNGDSQNAKIYLQELVDESGGQITHLEAVQEFLETNEDVEPETLASLIQRNQKLKAILYEDAEDLNLVVKESRLPVDE